MLMIFDGCESEIAELESIIPKEINIVATGSNNDIGSVSGGYNIMRKIYNINMPKHSKFMLFKNGIKDLNAFSLEVYDEEFGSVYNMSPSNYLIDLLCGIGITTPENLYCAITEDNNYVENLKDILSRIGIRDGYVPEYLYTYTSYILEENSGDTVSYSALRSPKIIGDTEEQYYTHKQTPTMNQLRSDKLYTSPDRLPYESYYTIPLTYFHEFDMAGKKEMLLEVFGDIQCNMASILKYCVDNKDSILKPVIGMVDNMLAVVTAYERKRFNRYKDTNVYEYYYFDEEIDCLQILESYIKTFAM